VGRPNLVGASERDVSQRSDILGRWRLSGPCLSVLFDHAEEGVEPFGPLV
jgi:hypothetical protein